MPDASVAISPLAEANGNELKKKMIIHSHPNLFQVNKNS